MNRGLESLSAGERIAYLMVFVAVTGVLVGSGLWVVNFVHSRAMVEEETVTRPSRLFGQLSPVYVGFAGMSDDYVSAESYLAMGKYVQDNQETINVQVLEGVPPVELVGYMLNLFSAGLGVDCTHCHNINDFSADVWDDEVAMANKNLAREHLRMTADLNQNWIAPLAELSDQKQPSGAQVICATCHLGQPQPQAWPEEQVALPDDFRLPLDDLDVLQVNARQDISLETVQYNQYVMYHMNTSMNVGCTHCHNSRYFPSFERPAKYYAQFMLEMSQHIWTDYADVMNNQQPSCTMCHNGAIIPPGAARSAADIPAIISTMPGEQSQMTAEQADAEMGSN